METWRPVVGFDGEYEVSDWGRVRSLPGGKRHGKVLKAGRIRDKYFVVRLRGTITRYVHHLVAEAFIGVRPTGYDICHNNGDKTDNRAENLRYDTKSANGLDAIKHGDQFWAARTHCKNGHEFTEVNTRRYTYTDKAGYTSTRRYCRECDRARNPARWPQLKAKRAAAKSA